MTEVPQEPTAEELAAMSPLEFNAYTSSVWGQKMAAADERRREPGSPFWRSASREER